MKYLYVISAVLMTALIISIVLYEPEWERRPDAPKSKVFELDSFRVATETNIGMLEVSARALKTVPKKVLFFYMNAIHIFEIENMEIVINLSGDKESAREIESGRSESADIFRGLLLKDLTKFCDISLVEKIKVKKLTVYIKEHDDIKFKIRAKKLTLQLNEAPELRGVLFEDLIARKIYLIEKATFSGYFSRIESTGRAAENDKGKIRKLDVFTRKLY